MALLGFVGVYTFVKTDAEATYERAEQGEEVYESDAGLETILFLLGAPLAAGAAAGAFVFRRLGGQAPGRVRAGSERGVIARGESIIVAV